MPPHRIYVEVFGGAANLLLNKAPSPIEVYYDIDGELVNLFLAVWDRPEDFAECFRLVLYSRGLYRRWFNGKQWYKCTQWVAGPEGFEPSTFELRASASMS